MVLTDPDKHGTEWGWKIIYGIFLWSASWGSLMTMKVLGFQLHPKSSRHPGTLLVPNGNLAPALQTRARTFECHSPLWVPDCQLKLCLCVTVLLEACCKHCTLTLEEVIIELFFCETYHVLLWLWRFYISIQLHPTCPRQLGHLWNFVSMK